MLTNLRRIRIERNYSLYKLAKETKISQSYLGDVEKGKNHISLEKVIRLSLCLNVSPNELIGWEELKDEVGGIKGYLNSERYSAGIRNRKGSSI